MKNKLSKRIFSLFLSLLMVVTALPITAYATPTEWTQVASTDFTKSSFDTNEDGSVKQNTSAYESKSTEKYITNAPAKGAGDYTLSWNPTVYSSGSMTLDSNGLYVDDGFMYLSGYSDSANCVTPITGASSFKIDVGFLATSYDVQQDTRYGFLTLGTSSQYAFENKTMNNSSYAFAQDCDGPAYVRGTKIYSQTSDSFNLGSLNSRLTVGAQYHYIITYSSGYLRGYIVDADYQIVQSMFAYRTDNLVTSDIVSISLGADDTAYYMHGYTYTDITFYTGNTPAPENADKDSSKTKFLFAYFTGQDNEDGEKIRFAVSDDGLNYEALNGNNPVMDNTPSAYYPAGGDSTGKAASGAARDPYIIQKRNADGSIGKGYYVLATDLKVNGSDYTNSKLLVWYLEDITQCDTVQPWSLETTGWFGASSASDFYAWAPEAVWDRDKNMYMMFWSSGGTSGGYNNICLHYVYTRDFITFYNKDMQVIGENGVTPDKLIYPMFGTGTGDNKCIDGTIMYDGTYYWLYFKRESEQQIYYCHSENPSGPYSPPTKFSDSDYTSGCEGVELFQLNDNSYVLMMDYYSSNGTFLMYSGTTLDGFQGSGGSTNAITTQNINHLSPRHGAITYITTDEYNALIKKFGKSTYDADGIIDGTPVNDTLVARYFTNSNVTYDATGHGYTLTNAGTQATAEVKDGRATAHFVSNSATSSSPDSGAYAYIDTSKMYTDYNLNEKDGVTFDWYGNASATNMGRFFEVSNAAIGELTWDTRYNKPYAYCASTNEFGGSGSIANGYNNNATDTWHHYTVTITNGYINAYVDGILQRTVYSKGSVSTVGCPLSASINADWFANAFGAGTLRFSTSVFSGDNMLDGYISDFRVYSKALSQKEIEQSIASLTDQDTGVDVNDDNRVFYDPMEDMDTTGDGSNDKTAYTATVADDLKGNALNVNGGVQTHNPSSGYTATASNSGYTISMWYNPGASISNETIFCIGRPNSVDGSSRQYFELLEDGHFYYNWEVSGTSSYIDITDAFGTNSLTLNDWSHIVIQVVPNDVYDDIYVYINGAMVNHTYTFNNSYAKSFVTGRSIHEFFAQSHDVYYGVGCGHWGTASSDSYIDDFSIYTGIMNANSVYKKDCDDIADRLVGKAISEYEAKMASILDDTSTVYTNMADAYAVYDKVVRYRDAMRYGGVEFNSQHVVDLYNEMVNALRNMEPYSKPATVEGMTIGEAGTTTAIDKIYTQNLLSKYNTTVTTESNVGSDNSKPRFRYTNQSFVWLYDGGTTVLTAPINSGIYYNGTLSTQTTGRAFRSIYVYSGDVRFGGLGTSVTGKTSGDGYWYYTSNATTDWYYPTATTLIGYLSSDTSHTYDSARGTWRCGSNYLSYSGTIADDVYWTSTTPVYYSQQGSGSTVSSNGASTIYLVNYVPAKNAMFDTDRMNILANITKYSPDSVKQLLSAYDDLTSLGYLFDSVSETAVTDFVNNEYKPKVEALTGVDVTQIEEKADYTEAIETAAAESVVRDELVSTGENTEYTSSSWNAYSNAVDAIENHFNSLDPYGNDDPYATTQDTVNRLNNNITAAKAVLVERADYTPVESKVNDTSVVTNLATNNLSPDDEQLYTYTTWTEFSSAYDTANGWATKSTAYKNDTEKYAVNYRQTNQTVQETENIYGPYIAYDVDGNVVTSDSQVIDHYEYIGVFYENEGDANPSQFETGDYVLIDGQYIKLNYHRYYATAVDTSTESVRQVAIKDSAANLGTKNDALTTVGDYSAYDASQELASLADRDAYADAGAAIQNNFDTYGTSSAPVTYSGTAGTPYITVGGNIYKDANQNNVDNATSTVLTTLNTNKRTYTVTFNVYVDGVATTETYDKTYGDVVTLNAVSVNSAVADCVLAKTTLSNTDSNGSTVTSYINNNSTVLERRIQKDTVVDMYFVSKVDGAKLVKVQDYFGCLLDAGYIMTGETVSVDNENKTISYTDVNGNDHNVSARESTYYTFNYFEVGGVESADTVTVADNDLIFTQRGTKSGNMTYTANDGTVNGETSITDVVNNTQLTFVADDTANFLVWVKTNKTTSPAVGDWYIASYQPTFKTFSADEGFVYQAVSNSNWSSYLTQAQYEKITEKLPFSFGTAAELINDNGVDKFRMYCDFAYDSSLSNVVIVEAGAVYSTTANDESTLYKGGANCRTVAANSINYDTNTYTITKTNAGTGNHYMRSYVSFTYTATVDGVETTIPRVVYGPVVKCENGSIVK